MASKFFSLVHLQHAHAPVLLGIRVTTAKLALVPVCHVKTVEHVTLVAPTMFALVLTATQEQTVRLPRVRLVRVKMAESAQNLAQALHVTAHPAFQAVIAKSRLVQRTTVKAVEFA